MLGIFGVIGYLMEKGGIPLAPAILALVLVPLLEDNFRRMLQISGIVRPAGHPADLTVDHHSHGVGDRLTSLFRGG